MILVCQYNVYRALKGDWGHFQDPSKTLSRGVFLTVNSQFKLTKNMKLDTFNQYKLLESGDYIIINMKKIIAVIELWDNQEPENIQAGDEIEPMGCKVILEGGLSYNIDISIENFNHSILNDL